MSPMERNSELSSVGSEGAQKGLLETLSIQIN